jgi:hypothetical protein
MKKIVIEITDQQFAKLNKSIENEHKFNLNNETFSDYSINLNTCELSDWLEIDFNGKLDLGEVNCKIQTLKINLY